MPSFLDHRIKLFPWQLKAMEDVTRPSDELEVISVASGYGAGKSVFAALSSIWLSIKNYPEPVLACSISNVQLQKSLFKETKRILDEFNIKNSSPFSGGKQQINFTFNKKKHTIFFSGLENLDSVIGMSVSSIIMDECARIPNERNGQQSVLNTLLSRIRTQSHIKHKKFICVSTPDLSEDDWFRKLCEKDLLDPSVPIHFHNITTYDNVVNGKQTAQNIISANKHNPKIIDAFVYGKFINYKEGAVYYGYSEDRNKKPITFDPDKHKLYIGLDFNINPAIALYSFFENNTLYVFKELFVKNYSTEQLIKDYIVPSTKVESQILFIGDASGWSRHAATQQSCWGAVQKTMKDLKRNNFDILTKQGTKNDLVSIQVERTNKNLYHGNIIIDPSCQYLIRDLQYVTWGKGNEVNKSKQDMTHLSDALNYLVKHFFEEKTETYRVSTYGGT